MKGRVPIVVLGLYFRPDITGCLFDSELVKSKDFLSLKLLKRKLHQTQRQ